MPGAPGVGRAVWALCAPEVPDVEVPAEEAGWGWAMWNLRGSFGPVDSGRDDVAYEEWHGHKLDRAMLDLLRAS